MHQRSQRGVDHSMPLLHAPAFEEGRDDCEAEMAAAGPGTGMADVQTGFVEELQGLRLENGELPADC